MFIRKSDRLLRLSLQFFAEGGAGGEGSTTGDNGGEGVNTNEGNGGASGNPTNNQNPAFDEERLSKLIQSQVDRATADLGKTIAELKKENANLKKQNMTAEDLAKAEREEFEKQKAEVDLQRRQIYAHKAVATAGYGDYAESVVDIILGENDEKTDERLTNFKSIIDKIVAAEVDKTFKEKGRTPNGANNAQESKTENTIAEKLGKARAEQNKQANDILKHYTGGN